MRTTRRIVNLDTTAKLPVYDQSGMHLGDDKAVELAAVPVPDSPISTSPHRSPITTPVVGSVPGASPDPSTDADSCNATASTSVSPTSSISSASFTTTTRLFPGQGLAPYIKPPLYMDYGSKVEIGTTTFINRGCKILDTPVRSVKIGERCLIGPDLSIYAVSHPLGTYKIYSMISFA